MGRDLRHIMVEWWRFYLICILYIIGTAQIILLLQINIDCRIYGLTGLFELNKDKQEEYI